MEGKSVILLCCLMILASGCWQKNPGISKDELAEELNRSASEKEQEMGFHTLVEEIPEGYIPPPGVKYQAKYINNAVHLDIEAALKNVRPVKLSDLGSEVVKTSIGKRSQNFEPELIPVEEGYLLYSFQGIQLLNKSMEREKELFKNDVDIENTKNGAYSIRFNNAIFSVDYDTSRRMLSFIFKNKEDNLFAGKLSLDELLSADSLLSAKDIRNKIPVKAMMMNVVRRAQFFSWRDGFAMSVPFTNELYTFSQAGDTLCHFTVGEPTNYTPTKTYRTGELGTSYWYNGNRMIRLAYDNTFYRIKDASTLDAVYTFDFGSLSRATGKDVIGGKSVDNSFFLFGFVETDHHLFIRVDRGYDCPNARRDKCVTLYSLIYNKKTRELFSLPQRKDGIDYPGIETGLEGQRLFWPTFVWEGRPAMFLEDAEKDELSIVTIK